jgi:hypothetical protein
MTLAVIFNNIRRKQEMNWHKFYFDRLPRFVNILKARLSEKLHENDNLNIEDYVKVFFEFYHLNDAYHYFKVFNVQKDKMYLGIYLDNEECKIYMERDIRIDDQDEEYQIQFELIIEIQNLENRISETYEVQRDIFGDFSNSEEGYFHFEDFQENNIYAIKNLDLLKLQPKSIRIDINADI